MSGAGRSPQSADKTQTLSVVMCFYYLFNIAGKWFLKTKCWNSVGVKITR